MPAHTITPTPPHDAIHAVCHLPCTVKTGIHPWRENLSKVPDAIECEHFPTQVGYDDELQSGRDPDEEDEHADELSLRQFLTVCVEILWLCKPIVAAAVQVAGLRRSWRWRCWMWRSWADVVKRCLRLWGRLDVLPNSLKCLWRRLMVEKWTFNSWATALVDMQSAWRLDAPSKLATSVALCCVIKLQTLEWHFIVSSLRHTCPIIMLSSQHFDIPHLWGGWIISAKEKCSLTKI